MPRLDIRTRITQALDQDAVAATVKALLQNEARTATLFLSPTLTVRACRRTTKRERKAGKPDARVSRVDLAVTIGAPNWDAVQLIKSHRRRTLPITGVLHLVPLQASAKAAKTAAAKAKGR